MQKPDYDALVVVSELGRFILSDLGSKPIQNSIGKKVSPTDTVLTEAVVNDGLDICDVFPEFGIERTGFYRIQAQCNRDGDIVRMRFKKVAELGPIQIQALDTQMERMALSV